MENKSPEVAGAVPLAPKQSSPGQPTYTLDFLPFKGGTLACPICKTGTIAAISTYPVAEKRSLFYGKSVYWCKDCGSGYVPGATEFMSDYYTKNYATSNRKDRDLSPDEYFAEDAMEKHPRLTRYFGRAKAQTALLAQYGAQFQVVLDYGSGPGYFLFACKGKQKFSVEPDQNSRKYLSYIGAVSVEGALPKGQFDTVCASHSLEHLDAAVLDEKLAEIAGSLASNGVLLAEVPTGGLSYLSLKGGHEPHTIFFSPQGLRAAFERTGLSLLIALSRAKQAAPPHPHPIYVPDPQDRFASARSGALTILAKRL